MKPHYRLDVAETLRQLNTASNTGLTRAEANKRLNRYGRNKIKEQEETTILQILISQLNNPVIFLLTAATVLAFIFGDIPEGIAIIVVILLNTIIGFWMEYQAKVSMAALKEMDKIKADLFRNGQRQTIDAEELVPGDIIHLEAGAVVAADARILEEKELAADESPLTGESLPVNKTNERLLEETPVSDRTNMVFKGTAITNGTGKAVVTQTGMETEIGNISEMIGSAEAATSPLHFKLKVLTRKLIWVILGLASLFFLLGWFAGKDIYLLIQTAIAWAIAAIPEGLPIVASIALAKGMLNLARHNVIVKRLGAVETLGETTMIFTDKTGTLTKNQLTVDTIAIFGNTYTVDWEKGDHVKLSELENEVPEAIDRILEIAVLNNNAQWDPKASQGQKGDPLELALMHFAGQFAPQNMEEALSLPRLNEDPFDSEDMIMGTVNKTEAGQLLTCKGATGKVLERCSQVQQNGQAITLTDELKQEWILYSNRLAEDGLRTLAFAYRTTTNDFSQTDDFLHDLTFVGLIGLLDPPRPDVRDAVQTCRDAGIKVSMVTGDHPGTALNIGRKIGIIDKQDVPVIHGKNLKEELHQWDNNSILNTRIFSRILPRQKLDIISYFQDHGAIAGMTGDGVNDAPALKKADIGIAMGKRGQQVAREVADMVLKDDAFPSIVRAVKQGRIIFGNLRKFIIYQLSYHLSEILVIATISFTLFQLPLLPLQLLFLNLLSDVFPALALGIGRGDPHVMKQPPKDPAEPIVNKKNWQTIIFYGIFLTIFVDGAYLIAYFQWELSQEVCNNVAFFSLALAQLFHVFDMRSKSEPLIKNQVTQNKYIWGALLLCFAALMVAYKIPFIAAILSFKPLSATTWLLIIIAGLAPMLLIQLFKEVQKRLYG